MSSALKSSAIQRFKGSNAIKIHDGITFDFYTGLPHKYLSIYLIVPTFKPPNDFVLNQDSSATSV